jgi:hypothetical protein
MTVQCSLRLLDVDVATIDKLAEKLSRPGFPARRADVLRMLVAKGIEAIEAEMKKGGRK